MKKGKKVISVPAPIVEEMEVGSGGEEVDFEKEQREGVRVEIPQNILRVVTISVTGDQEKREMEPVETLSLTFLQNLASERMDMGEEYEREISDIVQELEESRGDAGSTDSPSRKFKEELIEREDISREGRKVGDGKVSSESTDETERIVIENSVGEESFMVRTVGLEVGHEEGEQPVPPGEVLTPPVNESTPMAGNKIRADDLKVRPLYVAKKQLWVNSKKRTDEEGSSCSDSESSTSRQSATSRKSGEKRVEARGDWPRGVGPTSTSQRPPRGYSSSSMRVRTKKDHEAGPQSPSWSFK